MLDLDGGGGGIGGGGGARALEPLVDDDLAAGCAGSVVSEEGSLLLPH